ncbi:MAG: DUF3006 domain-containing protein [Clostridia bacterium]|nr:DUF3006 domain-containing protein [Clostridia bacterium]
MDFTLDRIEDGVAVLIGDDGKIYESSPDLLPENVREGDVLSSEAYPGCDDFLPVIMPQKRRERSERISGLFEKLKNKNTDIER